MPRLSVIMPARNAQRFLDKAVASTLRSLPKDAELRVVDDGSTDATSSILQRWAERDRRLHVTTHAEGRGVWRSLNELAAQSDCEILGRMDADDICLPGRWVVSARVLRHADIACHNVVFIDELGHVKGIDQPGHFTHRALPYHLLLGCVIVHPSVSMRRAHFERLGGYRDTAAEDYELWMRSVRSGGRIVRSAVPGLGYRRHSGQVTVEQPWGAEGRGGPLDQAYSSLVRTVLGDRFTGDAFHALAAVRRGATAAPEADDMRDLLSAVQQACQALPAWDAVQLRWRLRREMRRHLTETG